MPPARTLDREFEALISFVDHQPMLQLPSIELVPRVPEKPLHLISTTAISYRLRNYPND